MTIGTDHDKPHARHLGGRLSVVHVIILAASLALTVSAWQFSKRQAESRVEQRFETARDHITGLLRVRMQKYEDALWSGVAAVESHGGDMTLDEWRSFAERLRLEEKYPGVNGVGIIHFLTPDEVAVYLRRRRAERPDFTIFPEHSRAIFMPISFIEPEATNAAAVGLDVAHEVNRRTAALAARDTGEARITGPIVLVQDAGATPGFLFYTPFRDTSGAGPPTVAGAVYAPFVVRNLLDGLLAKDRRHTSISITDAGEVIYDEHSTDEALHDPDPMFAERVTLDLYGRTWIIDIRSNLAFREDNTYVQPTVILIGGIVIEALIIALLVLMARANGRAVAYADRVTESLHNERRKLLRMNEELEHFAHATSHDLKTPIRGIGALTEIIREDLEDYFASPDARAEVAQNLDLIGERVTRMNDLIRGIIEYSRIGRHPEDVPPLRLDDLAAALTADFGLAPGRITIDSAVSEVSTDPISLRRVLENLVGNAVKYHTDPDHLKIVISCVDRGGTLEFAVSDNGPGIDPKYQDRVFGMFQTLRAPDDPESTGIGLAVVKKAVEAHGGRVTLTSMPGEGACFRFPWPAHPEQRGSADRAAPQAA